MCCMSMTPNGNRLHFTLETDGLFQCVYVCLVCFSIKEFEHDVGSQPAVGCLLRAMAVRKSFAALLVETHSISVYGFYVKNIRLFLISVCIGLSSKSSLFCG